jgi:4-hydroxymandelate oxidase
MIEPINVFDFEALAREKLSKMAYDYFAGGAYDNVTVRENRAAYDRIALLPRMLRDVSQRDLSVTVLGKRMPLPIMIAPVGFMGLAHADSEIAIASGAGKLGVTTILSTMSSSSLEEVAEAATAPLWFQLYIYKDRGVTRALVERAEAAGFEALVLTVDTAIQGRREQDIRNRWHLPEGVTVKNLMGSGMERIESDGETSGLDTYIAALWDTSISWKDVEWLRSITKLPVVLKGILRADDALLAVESGAAGVIVSNHGGRQVDTTPATIEVLPEIVEAAGDKIDILMDGGIRRGADVVKALALGAKAVLVGRPVVWGLSADGEAGVRSVLDVLRLEFDNVMGLCGCTSMNDLTRDLIRLPGERA